MANVKLKIDGRERTVQLKSLKITDLLTEDYFEISKWKKAEMAARISVLQKYANKRLEGLEKADLTAASPVYQSLLRYRPVISKGSATSKVRRFDYKNKTMNDLRREYNQLLRFFNAKTSTVKGAREYVNKSKQRLKDIYRKNHPEKYKDKKGHEVYVYKMIKISDEDMKTIFKIYRELLEEGVVQFTKEYGSEQLLNDIMSIKDERMMWNNIEELKLILRDKLTADYEYRKSHGLVSGVFI